HTWKTKKTLGQADLYVEEEGEGEGEEHVCFDRPLRNQTTADSRSE
uniref:Uncharacterized protein n=1 Tax=Caenorhabditis japonica TaxID=281687 RepID=A0A8R1IZZ8_CAEJA